MAGMERKSLSHRESEGDSRKAVSADFMNQLQKVFTKTLRQDSVESALSSGERSHSQAAEDDQEEREQEQEERDEGYERDDRSYTPSEAESEEGGPIEGRRRGSDSPD